jgi:hypothetical protein
MRITMILVTVFFILSVQLEGSYAQSSLPWCEDGTCTLDLDLKIGGDTYDQNQFLYGPSSIAVDKPGNLFILDNRETCIKKFNPDGGHLLTFGRTSQGPGGPIPG